MKDEPPKSPQWSDSRVPANAATAEKISTEIALSRIVTAQTILTTHYPEPKLAVKGLIPEGVTSASSTTHAKRLPKIRLPR